MVANKQDKHPLTAANWSPGILINQLVYRNELTGVDSILSALAILVKQLNIKKGRNHCCFRLFYSSITCLLINPLMILMPSFDVLQDIRNILKLLLITVKRRWDGRTPKRKGEENGLVGKTKLYGRSSSRIFPT